MLPILIISWIIFYFSNICINANNLNPHSDLNQKHYTDEKDSNIKVIYEATRSVCYTKGQAIECSPPFTNIAESVDIKATSTCGQFDQSEEICRYVMGHEKCETCGKGEKFGTHLLTDRHQMNNETCWVSGSVLPGDTVNLTLSLGKRFEVYYISLQPCGQLPDSIALYKSSDFGVTWKPWQYFSTDCYRAFHLPTSNEHNAQISLANIQEVLCVALKSPDVHGNSGQSSNVIAFSTTIGRPSMQPWSSALIDWMTMTDLRISLMRFPEYRDEVQYDSNGLFLNPRTLDMSQHLYQSDMHYSKTPKSKTPVHFSFSDLSIGGRCKCNGHANRCIRDRIVGTGITTDNNGQTKSQWGPLRCDCQHNTEGADCERCSPGYLDRPWARGTSESANDCKPCQCGNHTNQCIFSVKAFKRSGGITGGICLACQHHTEGSNCDQCIIGYYRDPNLTMGNEHACRECRCHPIGSIANQHCDRKTGQCPCKPGVVGQACNRCQEGYKQTRLPDAPCIKDIDCPPCERSKKRIRFKKFCRNEAVFRGIVKSRTIHGDLMRLEVGIQNTWRITGAAEHLLPKTASPNLPAYRVWLRIKNNSADKRHSRCLCPNLQVGQSYLFITRSHQVPYGDRMELLLDTHSVVLKWRESWRRRLSKFVRRAARESCDSEKNSVVVDDDNTDDSNYDKLKRTRRVQRLRPGPDYYSSNTQVNQHNRIQSPTSPSTLSSNYHLNRLRSSNKLKKQISQSSIISDPHSSKEISLNYPHDKDKFQYTTNKNVYSSFYSNQ
ncbi:putative netrin [Schistosoma mansoni]|uniref:putative netrin n=1 Tax=Schistosoma mansoni TaxID=6183 RepID=UPI0001A63C40|nr:putative netrin [Schistosoma mansoni]|eukprot:XP_018655123.1 putative netrin [Schistosoma mansoni]